MRSRFGGSPLIGDRVGRAPRSANPSRTYLALDIPCMSRKKMKTKQEGVREMGEERGVRKRDISKS